jgi:hypothetical protein
MITSIDGLSGIEEQLALDVLNEREIALEERKRKADFNSPLNQWALHLVDNFPEPEIVDSKVEATEA